MNIYGYSTEDQHKSLHLQWSREQQSRGHATNKKKVSRAKRQRDKFERKRQNNIRRERSIQYRNERIEADDEMMTDVVLKMFWVFLFFTIVVLIGVVYWNARSA